MSVFKEEILTTKQIRNKTLFGFTGLFVFFIGCFFIWKWLNHNKESNQLSLPVRTALNTNERFFGYFFSINKLTKTYSKDEAVSQVRVNGNYGMDPGFNAAAWTLNVIKNNSDTLKLSLEDIKQLPKTEIIFDFKCIEGWNQVTHWAGVKFSDFVAKYGLQNEANLNYTGLRTPDNAYYVGIDNKSMLHPQTILCYEMNRKPLPMNQGYPLRLIIPVKYGVKHLKRIGTISFSNTRPPDYWFEKGYDYYCGL